MSRFAAALCFVAIAALGGWAAPALATTYYVSGSGNDSASGTTQSTAWRSVSRVNSASLVAGDAVRFEGGFSFSGQLQPPASGSAGTPITFSGYGSGQPNIIGGIAFGSRSWLVFDGLRVDTGAWQTSGLTRGITTSSSGSGATDIVVRGCTFANVALGLLIQNRLDARWTVSDSTIRNTRDSGILIYDPNDANEIGGGPMLFVRNQILDTGLDASLNYYKHGVYDIGHDIVWRNNEIRRFADGGISLRARGNTLERNTIADGPYAIYFSPYDTVRGTTTIAYNRLSNVTSAAIELAAAAVSTNVENFVIANNTIAAKGSAPGIRVLGTTGSLAVANNIVTAESGPVLRVDTRPGGGISERSNLWYRSGGGASWGWLGSVYATLGAYQTSSGLGSGDRNADPLLGSDLTLGGASPAIDGGTSTVDGSLSYVGDCSGATYHYCGGAVDMGALESGSTEVPAPVTTTVPTTTTTAPTTTTPAPSTSGSYAATIRADAPRAFWELGERSGTGVIDSMGNFGGAFSSSPLLGSAGITETDTAVTFNGTTQYAQVPFVAALNTAAFTVEAWAKVTGGSGSYRAVVSSRDPDAGGGHGYMLYAGSNDRWQFWLGPNSTAWTIVQGPAVVANRWTHVVGTYDGTTARLYVDGVLAATKATGFLSNSRQPLRIGAGATGAAAFYFRGSVDEVAVYPAALTATKVSAHFAAAGSGPRIATSRSLAVARSVAPKRTSLASSRRAHHATTSRSRRRPPGR